MSTSCAAAGLQRVLWLLLVMWLGVTAGLFIASADTPVALFRHRQHCAAGNLDAMSRLDWAATKLMYAQVLPRTCAPLALNL